MEGYEYQPSLDALVGALAMLGFAALCVVLVVVALVAW